MIDGWRADMKAWTITKNGRPFHLIITSAQTAIGIAEQMSGFVRVWEWVLDPDCFVNSIIFERMTPDGEESRGKDEGEKGTDAPLVAKGQKHRERQAARGGQGGRPALQEQQRGRDVPRLR